MLVWPVAGFFVVIAFGVGLISMAAFDSTQDTNAASGAAPGGQTIEVRLGDLFIEPAELQAQAGAVSFEVTNDGQTEHNFAIEGYGATEMIPPGETTTLQVASLKD